MKAQIVHYTPGRLRIQIPAARHQTAYFADLQRELLCVEAVLDVTVNPTAASLVIIHDSRIDPVALCRQLPGLAVTSSAVHPGFMATGGAASAAGGADLIALIAKLLPLVFARHPIAQLAEPLAEPILRAVVDSMVRPSSYRLPAATDRHRHEEYVTAIAA